MSALAKRPGEGDDDNGDDDNSSELGSESGFFFLFPLFPESSAKTLALSPRT